MAESPSLASDRVQSLWIGPSLSAVERLTIASFLRHHGRFDLYVYQTPSGVPDGTTLVDANEVVPEAFFHRFMRRRGRHATISAFANLFRYQLVHSRGGLWVDMDVVCLAPFEFDDPYVFGWEDEQVVNCAIYRAPPGSALGQALVDVVHHPNRVQPGDDARTKRRKLRARLLGRDFNRWGLTGPRLLTRLVHELELTARVQPREVFYPVHYRAWEEIFVRPVRAIPDWPNSRAIHLWQEMLSRSPIAREELPLPGTLLELLCRDHEVL